MGTQPISKLLISMSIPMMLSMLVQALYNVVDSVFVARISEAQFELTAVSTAFPIQNLMIAFGTGMGVGFTTLISKSLGEGNPKRASRAAAQGMLIEAAVALIFTFVGIFGARAFMESQTSNHQIIEFGTQYLSICCTFCFGIFIEITFEKLLQSTGKTLQSMLSQAIGAIINIILDPILIFGLLGAPEMGIKGAAVATVIGQMCSAVIAMMFHFGMNKELRIRFGDFKFHKKLFVKILLVGLPSSIMVAIGSVMNYCINKILFSIKEVGEMATTVFGIYFKLQSFLIMPVVGLNNGMVPIVAFNYGAKNKERIMKTIIASVIIAVCIMLCGLCVFQFAPEALLDLFGVEDEMMEMGITALRTISLCFVFAGFCIIISSVFQALGNGIVSMIISFARQIIVLVPVAFLFARFGTVEMVWYAFPIAECVSMILCVVMFVDHYKKLIKPLGEIVPEVK